ncbi:MAG: Outer membrane porin F precursor [Syntrophaceae bacterium PtaU1.Bin231]|nr:MAG: Outer membrane porin F precursor [Syntrophaceae bacterium PtaU1.Bin231]
MGVAASPRVSTPILFETGSARISKASQPLMAEIAAALNAPELRGASIRIEGHTDSVGDPGYNLKLSLRRAQAVRDYLSKNGIAASRLTAGGKGDTQPVADNKSEAGRKKNRRVDFIRADATGVAAAAAAARPSLVYAVDVYPMSYYQSASVLTLQRGLHIKRAQGRTFFGLGDPVFGADDRRAERMRGVTVKAVKNAAQPDIMGSDDTQDAGYAFGRLPNTEKEVREVARLFGSARTLIGPDASEERVKAEDLTGRRYVLFSTHGILGNEIPYVRQPALVLNLVGNTKEDGFLTAAEIFGMNLNAELVGLSACQTGLGVQSAGEGVVGLSRAFMYAGADSVLVSLWSVSDESTYRLMVKFFEGLNAGKDKLTALKEAKRHLRAGGYDSPFYWAPFIIMGEAN